MSIQEKILDQLPGLICSVNQSSEIIYINREAAKIYGFKDPSNALGELLGRMPCKAAEFIDVFKQQNNSVIKTNSEKKYIDVLSFANDKILTTFKTKTPLILDDDTKGVTCHSIIVSKDLLIKMNLAIANSDKRFRENKTKNQRSYEIIRELNTTKLSTREIECLFYLVRGKTSDEISKILRLSKRTIESYVENIKNKFNCKKKSDLIEIALDNHFIDLIPESIFQDVHKQQSTLLAFS